MNPRWRRVALLILLIGAFAWQFTHRHGAGAGAGPHREPVLAVSALAPDVLQVGRLRLQPCNIGKSESSVPTLRAYCTPFTVPEDWDAPAGRQIRLKVAMLRSGAASADPDPVVFLDGGPGGAASDDFPGIAPAFEALRRRHLVLLIDQRGTGGSNPLSCDTEQGADARDGANERLTPAVQRARSLAGLRACLQRLAPRAAPQFYTTSAAVRDLEAVRQAIGAPPLNLLGISYGTRVAQQYARRYPQYVRTVVLDSPVPNDLALGSEHARNLDAALRALALRCRADQSCMRQFGDPYELLQRVQLRLRAHPQTLALRDPYTFESRQRQIDAESLAQLMRFYAYSPITAALIPYVLKEADEGRYAALLGQTQLVVGEISDSMDSGMALSVICSEDADLLRVRAEDEATVLGNALTESLLAACPVWPHAARPVGFREPLRGTLPVLILAGAHDPVTPSRYAEAIASHLPRARLLILAGQGHGLTGVGCVPRLLEQFVQAADPKAVDASCLKSLGETPLFVDANGAGP
jgi:pimeloyl-ACP methyl ester carboxylesterase